MDRRIKIDGDLFSRALPVLPLRKGNPALNASVVHQHIEARELACDPVAERNALGGIANIADASLKAWILLLRFAQLRLAATADDYFVPGFQPAPCERQTDAIGTAGDKNGVAA